MKIAWLYTCSKHRSCPAHGCGRRTDHRNLEISRTQKFFQTYEKSRTTNKQPTETVCQPASVPYSPDDERVEPSC